MTASPMRHNPLQLALFLQIPRDTLTKHTAMVRSVFMMLLEVFVRASRELQETLELPLRSSSL